MTPVNFPNPPAGYTHKVLSRHTGGLLFFFNKSTGELYDTQFGEVLYTPWTLEKLGRIGDIIIPLDVELENK